MNEDGLNGLLKDKFEIGGEVVWPLGLWAAKLLLPTNPRLDAGISFILS